jgi:RNA polymerase sigma factor (sigma-70 family)
MILEAGQTSGSRADAALAELCRTYWYPVYAFARRKGCQPADAKDLTQAFFAHLIETNLLQKANPKKGRFRSFLLGCFRLFMASENKRAQAQKRGGESSMVLLDIHEAELRFLQEPVSTASPEELFDRHWAMATFDASFARLESEMRASNRAELYQELLPSLRGDDAELGYAELARRFGTTEAAVKVSIHRLRLRFREILHGVVGQTLNDPADVKPELSHLLAAMRG